MSGETPTIFVKNESRCNDDEKCDLTCTKSPSLGSSSCLEIAFSNAKLSHEIGAKAALISNVSVEPHSIDPKNLSNQSVLTKFYYTNEKKSCNCTKSHCLKLYCECFARGQSCIGCSCSNCMNNIDFEEDRTRAIQQTLDKNPSAFYPKIGCVIKKHSRGCNCKRSSCLKNYCECFEAKIFCSDLCKCKGCRNCSDSDRLNSTENSYRSRESKTTVNGFDAYITPGLIEVVCSCMLSQLILSESGINQEAIILVEFAKFLEHVLKSMTIQIKNEQINYFSFVESPSKGNTTISLLNNETAPYSTSTGYSDDITNDTNAVTLAEQSNLIGRSNECTKSAQTLSKYHTFSEINYETIQPSFRSFLSSNEEAETQRVYGNCGIPFSSESTILPSNYQFTTQPHLVPVVPLDPTIQNDNMVAEILPYEQTVLGSVSAENYSSEADLAVAAISSEMSSSNSECNSIYGFQDCGPDYCSSYTAL